MKQAFLGLVSVKTLKNNYLSVAIVAAFLLISLCASAQSYDSTKIIQDINAYGYRYKNIVIRPDGSFRIPTDTIHLAYADSGAIATKRGVVFIYNGQYWSGAAGGGGTIIITDTSKGIDSITYNGYSMCWYPHDSIVPRCWQLNTFFDDVRLSDDSTLYEFYNGDSLVKTVPSGIKNVGAVWPLSYNGTDLTTSKPFNDSLYLSSLVLHGTSLYSKKLTGDSVLIGTISGSGGSSGISKVGSPAYGLTRTNDSTYIVDTAVIASQARLSAMLALKLNITDTANMRFRPIAGTNVTLSGSYPNITINSSGTSTTTSEQVITATASQTAFTFTSVPSSYDDYIIFVNGAAANSTTHYTTSGNIVTITTPLDAGDKVTFRRIK